MNRSRIVSILLSLLLVISIAPGQSYGAAADGVATTIRLASLEGSVLVENAAGKEITAKADMKLYEGYKVTTSQKSYALINLDDSKVVKVDANSKIEVGQAGKKLEVRLIGGQIFFNVTKKLGDDETFTIKTSNMTTGVRGTSGTVGYNGAKEITALTLLTGKLEVQLIEPINAPEGAAPGDPQAGQRFIVEAGQRAEVHSAPPTAEGGQTPGQPGDAGELPELRGATYTLIPLTQNDIPGIAAEALRNDPALSLAFQAVIEEHTLPIVLTEVQNNAPAILEREQQATADQVNEIAQQQQAEVTALVGAATEQTAVDPTFEAPAPSGGGGGGYTPPSHPSPTTVAVPESGLFTIGNNEVGTLTGSSSANITVNSGGTLNIDGALSGSLTINGGTVNNNSNTIQYTTITVRENSTLNNNGTINGCTIDVLKGTLNNNSTGIIEGNSVINAGNLSNCGTVTNAGSIIGGTTINVGVSGTPDPGVSWSFTNSGTITVSTDITIYGGNFENAGTITPSDSKAVKVEGGTLTNTGTINFGSSGSSGGVKVSGGELKNNGSGSISANSGDCVPIEIRDSGSASISGGTVSNTSGYTISNSGILGVNGGTVSNNGGYSIFNSGTLGVSGGTVSNNGGGAIFHGAENTLTVSGGLVKSESGAHSAIELDSSGSMLNISRGLIWSVSGDAIDGSGTLSFTGSNGKVRCDESDMTVFGGDLTLATWDAGTALYQKAGSALTTYVFGGGTDAINVVLEPGDSLTDYYITPSHKYSIELPTQP